VLIKICGCRSPEDAQAAVEAGADAVGIILVPGASRSVSWSQARGVLAVVPGRVLKVGVFADQPVDEILAAAELLGLDAIQLHGDSVVERRPGMWSRFLVLQRWSPGSPMPEDVDWILAEPKGQGGLGRPWDWASARGLGTRLGRPVLLSGGLTPDNVQRAIEAASPEGVDVSSGVEAGGRKDPEMIGAFCLAVRGCQHVGTQRGWR